MTPERKTHLLISSLRQRAVAEANEHYGGDDTKGLAGELNELADEVEISTLHNPPDGCLDCLRAERAAVPGRSPDEDWLS